MKTLKALIVLAIIFLIPAMALATNHIPITLDLTYQNKTYQNYSQNNPYDQYGKSGGVFWIIEYGKLKLYNDKFYTNKANSLGGAILNFGTLDTDLNVIFNSNTARCGGAIINYSGTANINSSTFINNSATLWGGALENTEGGTLNIYNTLFSSNTATQSGGAIQGLAGTITITSSTFIGNTADSYGGVIANESGGTITISSSIFTKNISNGDGGVIKNQDNGTINIESSIFNENKANEVGGVIFNNNGTITITSSSFAKNKAESDTGRCSGGVIDIDVNGITIISSSTFSENRAKLGGAIENNGITTITNSIFSNNISNTVGGAIDSSNQLTISSSVFIGNSAEYGGAINNKTDNAGIITIQDGAKFNYNIATSSGGAIFNEEGTINLIADTGNIEFTGNIANGLSNAIYDQNGTINLWVSDSADIIFNDRITSEDNTSILNINQSTTTLTANGKVVLNEDMSGYTGIVNIYDGEVELKSKTNGIDNINTNKFFSGNINFSSETLNILNNSIDNITVSTWTSTSNSNLKFDTDLSNNTSDNFTITNSASGILNLTEINILGVNEEIGTITLFNNEKSPELNILTTGNYGGYEYIFSTTTTKGILSYKIGEKIELKDLINRTTPSIKSYSFSKNEIITEDLGNLGGTQLTIFGNNRNITGNNVDGIYVGQDKILNVENINNYSGFSSTYGAIKNEGILNISGTNFSNNEQQDIINNGILNLIDSSSTFEKGIIGTGTTTINNCSINLNNAIINQNNITINSLGTLNSNANNIIGNITNNGSLVFDGGTNNNEISGVGNLQIADNVINQSNITQNKLEIIENKQITNSTSTITINELLTINNNSKIINDGILIVGNGTNNGSIEQIANTANMTIEENFINNNTINQNNINVKNNAKLETIATTIKGRISNNGKLILLGGTNSNEISGDGTLFVSKDFVNNKNITQKNIIISLDSNISKASALVEEQETYLSFINSSLLSAENMSLNSTILKLTDTGILKVDNLTTQNSTIDLANSILQENNFKNLTIKDNLNLFVDADLKNKQMDTISADSFSGEGKINVKAINILSDATENKTEVLFTSSTVLKDKITAINTVSSELWRYDVIYNNGYFIFNKDITPISNPTVLESQIASAVGGTITQTAIFNQAFTTIDNIRNRIIEARNKGLLYASTSDLLFEQPNRIESGLWIRPYAMQDDLTLNDVKVDNTATGTLAGLDLSVGENSLLSFYIGYAGSNQKYEKIKVNQTGYVLGATGMIIKEDYYVGLTANINFNKASSESDYGTDDFDMNMYAIGAKAGYNIDLGNKWILEPNLTLMYGNINAQEYQTTQGAKIDSQSTNNILIEPQVKAKLDLTDGWTPYALVGYMLNSGDKTKLVANSASFEDMQISGYTEYGLGVSKSFKNSAWIGFVQITGKGGDRNGFEGNLGIKYSFLSATEKEDVKLAKYICKKEKIKQDKINEMKKKKIAEENRRKEELKKRMEELEKEKKKIEQENQRKLEIKNKEEQERLEQEELEKAIFEKYK